MSRLTRLANFPLHKQFGITEIKSSAGKGSFMVEVNESCVNPNDVLHGGVLYLLCDICAYTALVEMLKDDEEAVSHDIHVSLMRPVNKGEIMHFSAEVLKKGRSLCFIRVEALLGDKLVATSTVTKSIVPR